MEEAITKDNVFMATCIKFTDRIGDCLVPEELSINEKYRKILFFRGKVIDFETADDLPILPVDPEDGVVNGPVEAGTYYIVKVDECTQLTNKDMEYIPTLLNRYQEKKIMEKSKRLIKFPKKTLN